MSEVSSYRNRMRKNALKVILGLYALVVTPFLFNYLRMSSLASDSQAATARVTWSRGPISSSQDDRGKSNYSYTVGGRAYTGSANVELAVGSDLPIYYSQGIPANSSWKEPKQARDSELLGVTVISFGYGFVALIAVVLMSVISPPAGAPVTPLESAPGAEDIGISGR